jgi:hypothetical protein
VRTATIFGGQRPPYTSDLFLTEDPKLTGAFACGKVEIVKK